jgi:hypothetical protein
MAIYLRVEWHHEHEHEDEPIVLYSEIDDGLQIRKVEVYRSGRLDYADYKTETGTTKLSEVVMPSLDEIAEPSTEHAPGGWPSFTFWSTPCGARPESILMAWSPTERTGKRVV